MNFRQTEVFKVIMETGSITQAAARLYVSQPSISKSLHALERDLRLRLFERTGRGLVATLEAHALYAEVQRAYDSIESLTRFASGLTSMKHTRLIVSAIPALASDWIPAVTASFMRDFPEASLTIQSHDSSRTLQMVAEGRIDIGIAQSKTGEHSVLRRKLFDLATVCVLPKGHRLCARKRVKVADLAGEALILLSSSGDEIRAGLDLALREHQVAAKSTLEIGLGLGLCALVENGLGIGLVDAETARLAKNRAIVFRPFSPTVTMPIYAMRSAGRAPSAIASAFEDTLRRLSPPLSGQ
ncbi:LysR substrate-binding domain-containing protein [Caballeronia sp. LZ043]|uniref:LysR substrate-binding domain-containing protein n=1 Tax=Caballeronia sp. LZ043 TaxID=3038569 RepID=UPI00285DCFDC|nr:LysR substrate-binding domain-containing protein [Caballeronia sp. LZ043]MDR5822339.1 LysR substrate-binding domain-containing protein [Caballeronia sp. LZ043]